MDDRTSSEGSERISATNAQVDDVVGDEYRLIRLISSGGSGEVWRSKAHSTGQCVALKIMYTVGKSVQASRARQVAELLHISPFPDANILSGVIETSSYLRHPCLIFELHGMSLRDLLNEPHAFPIPSFQTCAIIWQVCNGIAFLHGMDIAHTDIKPENVVLVDDATAAIRDIDSDGKFYDKTVFKNVQIKIIDLEDSVTSPRNLHYVPGTVGYHPPEVYGKNGWSFPVDVFAIGCLTFELFAGIPLLPWTEDTREYFFCVEKTIGRFGSIQVQDISEIHPSIFRTKTRVPKVRGATLNPKTRTRLMRYIGETKWLRKSINQPDATEFISMCTAVDPHRRLSIGSTLRHRFFSDFSRAKLH